MNQLLSFRERFSEISGSPKARQRIPGDFHSAPSGIKAMFRAMKNPLPAQWIKVNEREIKNRDWTEENQGVTHDCVHWYFSSNKNNERGIYKFSSDIKQIDFFQTDFTGHDHIGDIDHFNGRIYAAMEKPLGIFWVNTALDKHGLDQLKSADGTTPSPQTGSMPWCAINPWNGLLYSSENGTFRVEKVFNQFVETLSLDSELTERLLKETFSSLRFVPPELKQGWTRFLASAEASRGTNTVYAYDAQDSFRLHSTLTLDRRLEKIQGGCFTDNGHLLLTSDHSTDISCFSALNGHFLGSAPIRVNHSSTTAEEVEGLTVRKHWRNADQEESHIHLILLDNDAFSRDDIHFKHFVCPDPAVLSMPVVLNTC